MDSAAHAILNIVFFVFVFFFGGGGSGVRLHKQVEILPLNSKQGADVSFAVPVKHATVAY